MKHSVESSFNPSSLSSHDMTPFAFAGLLFSARGGEGGGRLPYKGLMGMCPWMGSYFMTGLTIMGPHIFGVFGVRRSSIFMVSKRTRMFVLQMKSKVFLIQSKKWVNS